VSRPARFLVPALLLLPTMATPLRGGDRITGRAFATRSEVIARNGMVATSQPLATQAALDILRAGGNAVDAAIAANAVLALVEPTGCGLGGDLFAIVWDAEGEELHGLNASGRSPMGMTLDDLRERGLERIPSEGPLPVTVPGCVDGWFELHGRFGSFPMSRLLGPAIEYARRGFPVSELIAHYWERNAEVLAQYPGFSEQFLIEGRAPRTGEVFHNPNLARTLATIARGGRKAFYEGELAQTIVTYLEEQGSALRLEDFATHRSSWVEPVSTSYRGYDVWELPPNGQGIAALQMLNVLEAYDIASMGFGSVEYLHLLVEVKIEEAIAERMKNLRRRLPGDIAEPDRTWLALAAYNIGMGHLEDARVLTERARGDPHHWRDVMTHLPKLEQRAFYNTVRHGYARGREAVRYVQNIRHYHAVLQWRFIAENRPAPPLQAAPLLPEPLRGRALRAL